MIKKKDMHRGAARSSEKSFPLDIRTRNEKATFPGRKRIPFARDDQLENPTKMKTQQEREMREMGR